MRMNALPNVDTKTQYSRFAGGLDLVSPPLTIDAGKCISINNYECNSLGGYRRIDGYERFDGHPSPSAQSYYYCPCTFSATVTVGQTITGAVSSATGKVLQVESNYLIIDRVTGTFQVENFKVSGVVKGALTILPSANGHPTGLGHATALGLTADDYRQDISAVAGSGVIRGVCMYKGVAYAFRDNAAGTAVDIWKSTSTGWQKITLFKSLPYKNCVTDVLDGVILTQKNSGATATVKRKVIETKYNQLDLEATSITSLAISLGSHTFTIESGKAYQVGQTVIVTAVQAPVNYWSGTVTSYSGTQLVINMIDKVGSGTYADWTLHAEPITLQSDQGRFIVTNITGTWTNNPADKIMVGIVEIAEVDLDRATITAGNFVIGKKYEIKTVGTTSFTSIGAASNTVGVQFTATGVGSGTGDAYLISDPVTQISILQGGNYQFVQYNFSADTDGKKLYGTDSLNRAFEFDGDVYIPINTQVAIDAPTTIAAINNQLVLSFFGTAVFSAVANPHNFVTTSAGFQDLQGFGDTITGMSPIVGGVLAVSCRDSLWQVSIDAQTNYYKAEIISPDVGSIHYGLMNLGGLYSFDDKGIIKVVSSYVFGGFEHDTISRAIQPVIDRFREKLVAIAAYKNKNQVRFYANDGTGIIMTMGTSQAYNGTSSVTHQFSEFTYPINVSYAWNGEDASGRDIVLLGDNNGYVYVANTGSSFDGEPIQAYIRTAFNNVKSPSAIKRFRKLEVEMSTVGYSYIRFNPDFSYADPSIATHQLKYEELQGSGGYWDEATWNEFYYDGKIVSQPEIRIQGSGTNIGLVVFSNSAIDLGHNLSGVVLHYTPRKLNR